MIYHVAKNGSDQNPGTKERPFLTINKATSVAMAKDTVIVHESEYRVWVKPRAGMYIIATAISYRFS